MKKIIFGLIILGITFSFSAGRLEKAWGRNQGKKEVQQEIRKVQNYLKYLEGQLSRAQQKNRIIALTRLIEKSNIRLEKFEAELTELNKGGVEPASKRSLKSAEQEITKVKTHLNNLQFKLNLAKTQDRIKSLNALILKEKIRLENLEAELLTLQMAAQKGKPEPSKIGIQIKGGLALPAISNSGSALLLGLDGYYTLNPDLTLSLGVEYINGTAKDALSNTNITTTLMPISALLWYNLPGDWKIGLGGDYIPYTLKTSGLGIAGLRDYSGSSAGLELRLSHYLLLGRLVIPSEVKYVYALQAVTVVDGNSSTRITSNPSTISLTAGLRF